MVLNFLVAGIVSLATPAPPREIQELVDEIRMPQDSNSTLL